MALTKIPNNLITADAIDGTLIANNAINSWNRWRNLVG